MSDDLIERLKRADRDHGVPVCSEAADALAAKDTAISEMRAELERWQNNWDANVQEMSEKFRAVNLAQVMAGTNMDLLERLTAAEAQLERVKAALEDIRDGRGHCKTCGKPAEGRGNAQHVGCVIDGARCTWEPQDPQEVAARALCQEEPADLGVGG